MKRSKRLEEKRQISKSSHDYIIIQTKERIKQIRRALLKDKSLRTGNENSLLELCPELVNEVQKRLSRQASLRERLVEREDPIDVLETKTAQLAGAIKKSKYLVIYTGAGISTAASIPDYRGPNGVWTLLQKGKDIGCFDFTHAEPTLTHMCLAKLFEKGFVKHIVSQNCDGLHLRSGIGKKSLSEVHGNMYIEVCLNCKPSKEYVRSFDVTEKTARHFHKTGRLCYECGFPLKDTVVHFGERGRLKWPINWKGAAHASQVCDTILCLGSSLKVLKNYPWLWGMDRQPKKRPELYIVNLQWTPKDDSATLKINGKCDDVMKLVMKHLGLLPNTYSKSDDPLFNVVTPLHEWDYHTTSRNVFSPWFISSLIKRESDSFKSEFDHSRSGDDTVIPFNLLSAELSKAYLSKIVSSGNWAKCKTKINSDKYVQYVSKFSFIDTSPYLEEYYMKQLYPRWGKPVNNELEDISEKKPFEWRPSCNPGWFGKGCKIKTKRLKK